MFLIMQRLDWVNSYQALILPWAFTAFGTFLLRQFFSPSRSSSRRPPRSTAPGTSGFCAASSSRSRRRPSRSLPVHLHLVLEQLPVALDHHQRHRSDDDPLGPPAVPGPAGPALGAADGRRYHLDGAHGDPRPRSAAIPGQRHRAVWYRRDAEPWRPWPPVFSSQRRPQARPAGPTDQRQDDAIAGSEDDPGRRACAGDRLPPEADLAANLGLSRASLREAVRALTLLGVIDTRQGDGSYITGLGPELLLGALGLPWIFRASSTCRTWSRSGASSNRRRPRWLPFGRPTRNWPSSLLHPPELTGEQAEAHVQLDYEFHHAIARASGNPLLAVLLDGLAAPTVRMRVWRGKTLPGVLDRTLHEHRAILDALEARDPLLAHAAATMHVAGVEAWVRGLEPGWSSRAAREVQAEPLRRCADS